MRCPHCGAQATSAGQSCAVCAMPVHPQATPRPAADPPRPASQPESADEDSPTATRQLSSTGASSATTGDSPLAPGQAFGTRYRILKQLGGGGMGVVYKAWDESLGLDVAIKVIRTGVIAHSLGAEDLDRRFKRELLLARQVTHKNVVRIHDLGEIDGIKYITMSYVDGADLATAIRKVGRMPVPRALRIARQIVAGLAAAHEAGVVHRDLKPANIMVDVEDQPLIMDFGIARSAPKHAPNNQTKTRGANEPRADGREGPATGIGVTAPGAIMGTLEYMAPEQARGEEADGRADIYAFGLILFDMLVGIGHHGAGGRGTASLKERADQPPLSPRALYPRIPEALDHIVIRCLATDPAARYQTAAGLGADLARLDDEGHPLPVAWHIGRRQIAAATLLATMAVAATWWFTRTPPTPVQPAPVSVLIADFANRTGDAVFTGSLEQALAVGIEAASFITSYPRHDALRVASEITPGRALDKPTARLVSIRESIKVVLAGSIQAQGSGYLISVEASDPSADEPLFTTKVTASGKDKVLERMGSLAARVRKGLGDARTEVEAGRETSFTAASLEAARSYTIAQELADSYKDADAIEHYKQAIHQDPNCGRAYAGWAYSAFRLGRTGESEAAWPKALALVERMTDREKYRTLGLYFGTQTRNYEKAVESYRALLSIYPADDAAHNNLAMSYFSLRRFREALEEGRRALEIYPRRLLYRGNYALFAMYAGDFKTAEEGARRLLEGHPEYYPVYVALAIGALVRSDLPASREAYERLAKTGATGASLSVMGLADLAAYQARFDEAASALRQGIAADERAGNRVLMAAKYIALAEAYQADGKKSLALAGVKEALKLHRRDEVLLPAARILMWAGRKAMAKDLARELESQLEPQSRAYAKIIEGEIALGEDRTIDALEAFKSAVGLADAWLARFDLGVLYVRTGRYAEALSELQTCVTRKGEATAIFLDDVPTYRYLAPLPYWLGRAQEGMGMKAAALGSYSAFLSVRSSRSADLLTVDARARLGAPGR
jgi:eukaryotic-like serine/threonine-protein kinase